MTKYLTIILDEIMGLVDEMNRPSPIHLKKGFIPSRPPPSAIRIKPLVIWLLIADAEYNNPYRLITAPIHYTGTTLGTAPNQFLQSSL